MNFSTLFRLGENLHLDKKTLVNLRWIAIIGQLIAINFVYYYFNYYSSSCGSRGARAGAGWDVATSVIRIIV